MSAPADGHAQVEHASPVDRRDNICFDRRLDHRERRFGVEVGPVCILLNPIPSRECDGCVWREAFVEGAEVDLGGHLGGDGWFGVSRGACGGGELFLIDWERGENECGVDTAKACELEQ